MRRILIPVVLSLFLCSTGGAFQGGGGESTKNPKPTPMPRARSSPKPKVEPHKRSSTPAAGIGALPVRGFEFDVVTVNSSGSETSRRKGQAQYFTEEIAGISLELVAIPGGTFVMGSTGLGGLGGLGGWGQACKLQFATRPRAPER